MCDMSEGSLPPFRSIWPRFSPGGLLKRPFGRLARRLRTRGEEDVAPNPGLRARAAEAIQLHTETHAALFERAARLREKAERLESLGTPSESAVNRAERAEREAELGLSELRGAFVASNGEEGRRAFDSEVENRYPSLRVPNASP